MDAVQTNSVTFKRTINQTSWVLGYFIGGLYEVLKRIIFVSSKVIFQTVVGFFNLFFGWLRFFIRSPALAIVMLGFFIYGGITVLDKMGVHFDHEDNKTLRHRINN